MSLKTEEPMGPGQCSKPNESMYVDLIRKCVKCDSSFTSSMVVPDGKQDSNGNPILELTCTYYPTRNVDTMAKTCYNNDKLNTDNKLCQKVFTISQ